MHAIAKLFFLSENLSLMINIGNRLKYLRKKLELSQLELSQRSNISQASIARIEANKQKNLKAETIEKLASALEIPLSQFLEEPTSIKEETLPYETPKMLPVVKLEEFINAQGHLNTKKKINLFEPALSPDRKAFFLRTTGAFISGNSLNKVVLLLIEPAAHINDGDMILFLSNERNTIGKIFFRHPICVLQPLRQESEPIIFNTKKRKKHGIRLFRISEIREKY